MSPLPMTYLPSFETFDLLKESLRGGATLSLNLKIISWFHYLYKQSQWFQYKIPYQHKLLFLLYFQWNNEWSLVADDCGVVWLLPWTLRERLFHERAEFSCIYTQLRAENKIACIKSLICKVSLCITKNFCRTTSGLTGQATSASILNKITI